MLKDRPDVRRKAVIVRLGVLDLPGGEDHQNRISAEIHAARRITRGNVEHLRLGRGEDKPLDGQIARWAIPSVRLHGRDQGRHGKTG